ncbi:MAG: CRISPR-associated endonuclease Cas1, partial [Planctomycetaceae bacterium]|nr:CRISPR-associated endonuclease Cas1 [Planctomycetaceae bacterium]
IHLLEKIRSKSDGIQSAIKQCKNLLQLLPESGDYDSVMGIEGKAATTFFPVYFDAFNWRGRFPRTKVDVINTILDIGYTILFNYVEVFTRLFGFDPYRGVYHQLWFKRKSLICDLVEPFRCLVDQQVRKAFNLGQCSFDDFELRKNEYLLKREKNSDYTKMFFDTLIEQKSTIFKYIQEFYRSFMQQKDSDKYPRFLIQ